MPIVQTFNLTKKYKKLTAVDNLNISIEKGEVFGLLGPNGAGKTTIIKMLITLLKPTSGTAKINGFDVIKEPEKVRESIGVVFQDPSSDDLLTGYENLKLYSMMYGIPNNEIKRRINEAFDLVELTDRKNDIVKRYSGGMRRRLEIARGLIHRPEILFLDEPTTGVDAVSRKEFWHMLKQLQKEGITILVSTPYMDEAALCDSVALIQNGKFLSIDTPEGTVSQFKKPLWAVKSDNMYKLQQDLRQFKGMASVYPFGEYYHLALNTDKLKQEDITGYLTAQSHHEIEVNPIKAGIEDVFMELMKSTDD